MLSNGMIKDRFYAGEGEIDRFGMFIVKNGDVSLARRLHYALLDGMSDKKALEQLTGEGQSLFEAKHTLAKTKAFIKDVLEIDLAKYMETQNSTSAAVYQLLPKKLEEANAAYQAALLADIVYKDVVYQVTDAVMASLSQYIISGTSPEFWVAKDNSIDESWSKDDTKALYDSIIERNTNNFALLTAFKVKLRSLADGNDYTGLQAATITFE